jgi:hypothetical protein
MSGARISVFRERDATGKRERGCFEGGRESLVLERPCLGAYSVAGRVGGRSRPLLWLYNVALTLPPSLARSSTHNSRVSRLSSTAPHPGL